MNIPRSLITCLAKKLDDKVNDLVGGNSPIIYKFEQFLQSLDSLKFQVKQFQCHRFSQCLEQHANLKDAFVDDLKHNLSSCGDENNKKKKLVKIDENVREVNTNKPFADHLLRKYKSRLVMHAFKVWLNKYHPWVIHKLPLG